MADNQEHIYKTLEQQEKDYFNEIHAYLFGINRSVDLNKWPNFLNTESYIYKYRDYNQRLMQKIKDQPGEFMINDIYLTIPPEAISVEIRNNTIDIPILRTSSSVKLNTGHGAIQVSISAVFTDNELLGVTLEEELKYKLVPLLTQMNVIPFVHVRNKFLREKIITNYASIINNGTKEVIKEDNTSGEILLTYVSHSIATDPELPRTIRVEFSFLVFNYRPYILDVAYPYYYQFTDKKSLDTLYRLNDKLLTLATVKTPDLSLPFYEFYAREFKKLQENGVLFYEHDEFLTTKAELGGYDDDIMQIGFYQYIEVPNHLLDPSMLDKVKSMEKSTTYATVEDEYGAFISRAGLKPWQRVMAADSEITSHFKAAHNRTSPHKGVDLKPKGSTSSTPKILAAHGGKVTMGYQPPINDKNGPQHGGGHYIFITDSGAGITTKYLHLSQQLVKNGDIVKPGQVIGIMGNSGSNPARGTMGAHLDFRIIVPEGVAKNFGDYIKSGNDYYVNPETFDIERYINNHDNKATPVNIPNRQELKDVANQKKVNIIKDPNKVLSNKVAPQSKTELKAYEQAILDYINTLIKKNIHIEYVPRVGVDNISYIRIPRMVSIRRTTGFTLTDIQYLGYHQPAIVPIAGHRLATHQYMGGRVKRMALTFIVSENYGDFELQKLLSVINISNYNAIRFKEIAAYDGIEINQPFINTICGGKNFVIDNINITTHPDIPEGSIVTISLTDFTGAKEVAQRVFDMEQLAPNMDVTDYYKTLAKEIFSKVKPTIEVNPKKAKSEFVEGVLAGIVYSQTNDVGAISNLSKPYNNFESIYLVPQNLQQFNDNPQLKQQITELFETINEDLSKSWLQKVFNLFANNDAENRNPLSDDYEIFEYLTIGKSVKNAADRTLIKSLFFPNNKTGDNSLTNSINKWLDKHSHYASNSKDRKRQNYFPKTAEKYSDDVKNYSAKILWPAYIDFNLPPTINPDYYFYQPTKNALIDPKEKRITENALAATMKKHDAYINYFRSPSENEAIPVVKDMETLLSTTDDISLAINKKSPVTFQDIGLSGMGLQASNLHSSKIILDYNVNETDKDNPIKLEVNVSERNEDKRDPDYERVGELYFFDHIEYTKHFLFDIDNTVISETSDFIYAFPVYKIYFIEEDDQEFMYPFRMQDFNDLFGINAVQEIRYAEIKDQPADLLTVRFVDMTGKFTSIRYKHYGHIEGSKKSSTIDFNVENNIKGLVLKEGTRVQFRVGYSNNINKLPIRFNGYIVSIGGEENEFEMMCQSYGAELVHAIKAPSEVTQIATFNADTHDILQWCISQPEVKHFGRWKMNNTSNLTFSDSTKGTNWFRYKRMDPMGHESTSWTWTKDEGELNFLCPVESDLQGFKNLLINLKAGGPLAVWKAVFTSVSMIPGAGSLAKKFLDFIGVGYSFGSLTDLLWSRYWIKNTTVWQIVDELTYRYPEYIAKVFPYDDRVTLYYGPRHGLYFATQWNIGQLEDIQEAKNKLNQLQNDIDWNKKQLESYKDTDIQKAYTYENWLEKEYQTTYKTNAVIDDLRNKLKKPTTHYHLFDSNSNLISNQIKADIKDVYTEIMLGYGTADNDNAKKMANGEIVEPSTINMRLNSYLQLEDIKTKYVQFPNASNIENAYIYGTKVLFQEAEKLYKGTISVLGNPDVTTFDNAYVIDDATQTYGPIRVRSHVLSIAPGEGMISTIEPDMRVNYNQLSLMSVQDYSDYVCSAKSGLQRMKSGDFNWMNLGMDEYDHVAMNDFLNGRTLLPSVGAITTGIGAAVALATGAISATTGFVVLPAFYLLLAQISYKAVLADSHRDPIYVSPLVRRGAPYLYGLSTYKVGGYVQWTKDTWAQDMKDIGAAVEILRDSISTLFGEN